MADTKPNPEKPKAREPAKKTPVAPAAKPAAPTPQPVLHASAAASKRKRRSDGARDVGLGVPVPAKTCLDPKCPFHGSLRVRGSVIDGSVVSAKMKDTVVVERKRLRFIPKYERFESRTSRIMAHNPPCVAAPEGASVRIAECRPLSKKVTFCVVAITSSGGGAR